MIVVNGHIIKPSIFPDATSQIWQLPDALTKSKQCSVIWYFEQEREIIDLRSLRKILYTQDWILHIPYLPYARQDKDISNDATFNRQVLLDLLFPLCCQLITTVDIHSKCSTIFNIEVSDFHEWVIEQFEPHYLVFPDKGAFDRYPYLDSFNCITFEFEKARNQSTGQLTSHRLTRDVYLPQGRYLMVDDLCDGGATFISIAQQIKEKVPDAQIGLAITHGLFNKGKEILTKEGIQLFYTNSLLRNKNAPETEMFRV